VDALQRLVPVLVLLLALASLIAAIGLWRTAGALNRSADAGEQSAKATERRACIEAANSRYPAVGVSAFVTRDRADTGPIKLSFERERARAVARCK
jgi:hypothetical protein